MAVYIKKTLISERMFLLDNTYDCECMRVEVRQHHRGPKIMFIEIYRPPDSPAELKQHITKLLESASSRCDETVISGDFNIVLFKPVL